MQQAVCTYRVARRALETLNAPRSVLDQFQVLKRDHLKSQTAVIDPSARALQNTNLAWFWSMDISEDSDSAEWLAECDQPSGS